MVPARPDGEAADETLLEPARTSDPALAVTAATAATVIEDPRAGVPLLQAGTRIGRYVVLSHLGAGGMGAVYVAHDPELDRQVALKLLHPELASSDGARLRLRREARTMARLAHRHIVAIYDVGSTGVVAADSDDPGPGTQTVAIADTAIAIATDSDGDRHRVQKPAAAGDVLFIAMELLDGGTLRGWCRERSWRDVLAAYVAAGRGLEAAHAAGIVHRDFKPENVLVDRAGRVAVSDFGIAFASEDSAELSGPSADGGDVRLTRAGALIGTPAYMAPEQLDGQRADARSDQFSFCVTLWEALHGERPFPGDHRSVASLRAAIAGGVVHAPAGSRIPARIQRALRRGLAEAKSERWPTMAALLRELDPHRPRRWPVVAIAAALAGGAGVGAITMGARSADAPTCGGAAELLRPVWNSPRKRVIERAFAATGVAFGADTWQRVQADVDDWMGRWSAQRTATCAATRIHHEQSEAVMDARIACLDRRRLELDALLSTFERATPDALDHARSALAGLRPITTCAEPGLGEGYPAPRTPAQTAQVAAIEARLAHAEALIATGDYRAAQAAISDMERDARATGYPPVVARTLFARGRIAFWLEDHPAVLPSLEEALIQAEIARDDHLRAELWFNMGFELYGTNHNDEARRKLAAASGIIDRAGNDPLLRASIAYVEGLILQDAHDYEAAIAHLRDAMATAEGLGPPGQDLSLRILSSWSTIARDESRLDEAVAMSTTTITRSEEYYGRDHPRTAEFLITHGLIYLHRSRPGDLELAEEALSRALRILRDRMGPNYPSLGFPEQGLAIVHRRRGDLDQAMAGHRRAYELFSAGYGPDSVQAARALQGMANVHVRRAEWNEAVELLERVGAIYDRQLPSPVTRADSKFVMARALWGQGRDRRRARILMEDALAIYLGLSADAEPERAAARRWLADPDGYRPLPPLDL